MKGVTDDGRDLVIPGFLCREKNATKRRYDLKKKLQTPERLS